MLNKNPKPANQQEQVRPDVVKDYTDSTGSKLLLSAEFKMFNGRPAIAAITIRTVDLQLPISRRMLSQIPLEKLFRDDLAIEAENLNRILRNRNMTTAHQGRQHSDDDLRSVAEIYRAAFQARRPVQKAVAEALGVSLSTAAKRIMAARSRGFIDPTQEGK